MARMKFGEIALELGYLRADQLEDALREQESDEREGKPRRPLGIICMQQRALTYSQVVAILERQERAPVAAE